MKRKKKDFEKKMVFKKQSEKNTAIEAAG